MSLGRAEDASFVAGVVVCCRCHWESRPQEGGGIAQAWATWPEGASAPNGTMMCRGHGVPEMVLSGTGSLVGAIGRAGLRKEVGLLRPGPRGPKVLRHQMVR